MMRIPLHAALAAITLAAGAVAAVFAWQPGLATFHDDSASYLVMAQAFSPWHAASPAIAAAWPHEKYPPLFPALLAIAGAAHDWRWAHAIVAACFGASIWLLAAHAARITASAGLGLVVALTYALMPGAWLNMKGILSEFPYMAISFAALLAHRRFAEDPWPSRAWVFGTLMAAALLTRTIGIALWLAIAGVEIITWLRARERTRARRAAWMLGASLLAPAVFYLLRPAGGDDAYLQFGAAVARGATHEGGGWLAGLVASNLAAIFSAWLNALVIYWGEATQPKFLACAALGAAGLGAIAWRALRVEADGLYALAFLAILAAWPFPGQMYRLVLPVIPLVLAAIPWAVAELLRGRVAPDAVKRGAAYVGLMPLAFCVPALFYIAQRANAGAESNPGVQAIMEYYRIPFRPAAEAAAALQLRGFADMERIRATTGEGDRVMWYGPAYVALLAQREGVALETPRDAADLARQVREGRADYVYLSTLHPRDSAHRLGNPLAPARYLDARAPLAWQRSAPDGTLEAAMYDVRGMRGQARP